MLNILDMNSVAKLLNAEPAEDMEVGKLDMKSARKAAKEGVLRSCRK